MPRFFAHFVSKIISTTNKVGSRLVRLSMEQIVYIFSLMSDRSELQKNYPNLSLPLNPPVADLVEGEPAPPPLLWATD